MQVGVRNFELLTSCTPSLKSRFRKSVSSCCFVICGIPSLPLFPISTVFDGLWWNFGGLDTCRGPHRQTRNPIKRHTTHLQVCPFRQTCAWRKMSRWGNCGEWRAIWGRRGDRGERDERCCERGRSPIAQRHAVAAPPLTQARRAAG